MTPAESQLQTVLGPRGWADIRETIMRGKVRWRGTWVRDFGDEVSEVGSTEGESHAAIIEAIIRAEEEADQIAPFSPEVPR